MTTTVGVTFTPLSVVDVSVGFLDQTKLRLRKNIVNADGSRIAEYIYAYGDPTAETVVIVRSGINTKTGVVSNSVLLRATQVVTVDSVITETAPLEFSLNWNTPGAAEDTTLIRTMMNAAYSLCFDGVVSKVPQLGIIDAINRGIVSDLY